MDEMELISYFNEMLIKAGEIRDIGKLNESPIEESICGVVSSLGTMFESQRDGDIERTENLYIEALSHLLNLYEFTLKSNFSFKELFDKALEEKRRTDEKYGTKTETREDKAMLISCINENLGTMHRKMTKLEGKHMPDEYYSYTLTHMLSLAAHIPLTKPGAQYKTME